jgi:hypothetical protein
VRSPTAPIRVSSRGVVRRAGDGRAVVAPVPRPEQRLDDAPVPDYDAYFDRAERMGLQSAASRHDVWIPLETARGCWWGAKHHCVFCGLNATSMHFRAKSPQRVLDELATQARRYRSFRFAAVDNIVDVSYLKSLFPAIVDSAADYEFFYEAKANLTRAQIPPARPGRCGGVATRHRVAQHTRAAVDTQGRHRGSEHQPAAMGPVLRNPDIVGTCCGESRARTKEDYAAQAAVVPNLVHLRPPESADRVWLERFSPFYTRPGHPSPPGTGSRNAVTATFYPRDVDLEKVAYFFDYEFVDSLPTRCTPTWRAGSTTGRRPGSPGPDRC